MRTATEVSDQEYFDWINTPGNKPGDDCKYPTIGDAWGACHDELTISGSWKEGIGYFFQVISRWIKTNPFGNE